MSSTISHLAVYRGGNHQAEEPSGRKSIAFLLGCRLAAIVRGPAAQTSLSAQYELVRHVQSVAVTSKHASHAGRHLVPLNAPLLHIVDWRRLDADLLIAAYCPFVADAQTNSMLHIQQVKSSNFYANLHVALHRANQTSMNEATNSAAKATLHQSCTAEKTYQPRQLACKSCVFIFSCKDARVGASNMQAMSCIQSRRLPDRFHEVARFLTRSAIHCDTSRLFAFAIHSALLSQRSF